MLSRNKSKYNVSLDTSSWGRPHVWERPLETGMLGQVSYVHHTTLPVQLQIKDPSVQKTHPSQECDLKNVPPCPYKRNSSQKEVSTVNVMCFTACLSMAQWVDIIAFCEVEKTGGLWGDMLRYFCPPCISDNTRQSILTYHQLSSHKKKHTAGELRAVETAFADCSIYAAGTKSQRLSGSVSRVLLCCLHRQLPSMAIS